MTDKFIWDNANNPVGQTIDQMLYRVRSNDREGLIFDSLTLAEIIEDSEGVLAVFDALVTPYSRLERKVNQLRLVMDKAVEGVSTVSVQVSEPFKQNGSVHVAAIYELTDGQTVSVIFHNPDSTPSKLAANDEMISWKWMLNKKDITIVVAPEQGRDLAIREVGRRIMKLAIKNSTAFARLNQKRAEKLENIKAVTGEVEQLEQTLTGLEKEIEAAQAEKAQRELEEAAKVSKVSIADEISNILIDEYGYNRSENGVTKLNKHYYGDKVTINIALNEDGYAINVAGQQSSGSYVTGGTGYAAKKINQRADDALYGYMPTRIKGLLNLLEAEYGANPDLNSEDYEADDEVPVDTDRGNRITISINNDGSFDLNGLTGIRDIDTNSSVEDIAAKIDALDFANSIDTDEQTGLISEGEYTGKTTSFAYAAELLKKSAKAVDLNIVFGEFNATKYTQGLFDSSFEHSYNVVAQIAKGDVILGRAEVSEYGDIRLLKGSSGDAATDVLTTVEKIIAVFAKWVANAPMPVVVPKPKYSDDFDPTTPENYQLVKENNDLEMFQDRLDAFFQTRFTDIRNALRGLGWEGVKDLSKNGHAFIVEFNQVGAGGNLAGMTYKTDNGYEYADDLSRTAVEIAQAIDGAVPEPVIDPVIDPIVDPVITPVVDPMPDNNEDDEINTFLKDVIANPGNHTNDESLDKLTELAESLGDDETSEFAMVVNQAAKAVQEVAFKQLQEMVSQG